MIIIKFFIEYFFNNNYHLLKNFMVYSINLREYCILLRNCFKKLYKNILKSENNKQSVLNVFLFLELFI